MPIIRKCKICKIKFKTKPFFIKRGDGKYCSRKCHHLGLKKGKEVKCFSCKKLTYKSPLTLKRSKSKKFFCSKSCQTKWRNSQFIGEKHANWKMGRYAYRSVLARNKILQICKLCMTDDKRVLTVHHIDSNRTNNKVDNLVWLCHNCHHLVHHHNDEQREIMAVLV